MKGTSAHAIVVACLLIAACSAATVTIDNRAPRLDVQGNIMDAHDGSIQQFEKGGLYYMHAMQYGLCKEPARYGCDGAGTPDHCGWLPDHNISIWTSPDLSSGSWTYAGNAIDVADRPPGVVFRPHVVYNPKTKQYVLFWNYSGLLAVAAAATPTGPFKMVTPALNISRQGSAGDFDVFVDDDGKGYVIYSLSYYISIEELSLDFFHSVGSAQNSYVFPEYFVEAPIMMKKDGVYYALFGWCCCYCLQGSGIMVHTAKTPLGPYVLQAGPDLACVQANASAPATFHEAPYPSAMSEAHHIGSVTALPTPGQGCQFHNGTTTSIVRSQQNYIVKVADSTGGFTYIWTGDRWQQAPDGLKGHEPQYWAPLTFAADGSISRVGWVDTFTINF